MPAYLTLPGTPSKPLPTIVLIHGGAQARDRWGWDPQAQILAAHGYAVFQPQLRGSSGFGLHFEDAGRGQRGLAMQDDITAGVRYLIAHGIADATRICIVGVSDDGHAALRALARTPELYRCGVSDMRQSRPGDPRAMKATSDSVAPLEHADRITAPVLIIHGALDERVPIEHAKRLRDALAALDKDVTWLELPRALKRERHGVVAPGRQLFSSKSAITPVATAARTKSPLTWTQW